MFKVVNMKSAQSNKPVANQFVIETDRYLIYQSYETLICAIDKEEEKLLVFDYIMNQKISRTTNKYLFQFLSDYKFEIICAEKFSKLPLYKKLYEAVHSVEFHNVFNTSTEYFLEAFLQIK